MQFRISYIIADTTIYIFIAILSRSAANTTPSSNTSSTAAPNTTTSVTTSTSLTTTTPTTTNATSALSTVLSTTNTTTSTTFTTTSQNVSSPSTVVTSTGETSNQSSTSNNSSSTTVSYTSSNNTTLASTPNTSSPNASSSMSSPTAAITSTSNVSTNYTTGTSTPNYTSSTTNITSTTLNASTTTTTAAPILAYTLVSVNATEGETVNLTATNVTVTSHYHTHWVLLDNSTGKPKDQEICRSSGSHNTKHHYKSLCYNCNHTTLWLYNVTKNDSGRYTLKTENGNTKPESFDLTVLDGNGTFPNSTPSFCSFTSTTPPPSTDQFMTVAATAGTNAVWALGLVLTVVAALIFGQGKVKRSLYTRHRSEDREQLIVRYYPEGRRLTSAHDDSSDAYDST